MFPLLDVKPPPTDDPHSGWLMTVDVGPQYELDVNGKFVLSYCGHDIVRTSVRTAFAIMRPDEDRDPTDEDLSSILDGLRFLDHDMPFPDYSDGAPPIDDYFERLEDFWESLSPASVGDGRLGPVDAVCRLLVRLGEANWHDNKDLRFAMMRLPVGHWLPCVFHPTSLAMRYNALFASPLDNITY